MPEIPTLEIEVATGRDGRGSPRRSSRTKNAPPDGRVLNVGRDNFLKITIKSYRRSERYVSQFGRRSPVPAAMFPRGARSIGEANETANVLESPWWARLCTRWSRSFVTGRSCRHAYIGR